MPEDFPGNDHALNRLRELLEASEAIAFVGAGASAGLYPMWGELIRQLADAAVSRGRAEEADREYWLRIADQRAQQAVRGIKQALGDQIYGEVLREIFRPKVGEDGSRFTPVHAALMRLPFRGYVTTNYDPGLLEARLAVRPDVGATGYATWKDDDAVYRWLTGDIFEEQPCPILFAHGIYDRSDTVVLGVGEYREAYRAGSYRRLFEKLWGQDHLVFVGFGFSDTWLDFIVDEVITQTARAAAGEPRHLGLLGLEKGVEYTPEMRQTFHDQCNLEPIFYRIQEDADGNEDHREARELLEGLVAGLAPAPT